MAGSVFDASSTELNEVSPPLPSSHALNDTSTFSSHESLSEINAHDVPSEERSSILNSDFAVDEALLVSSNSSVSENPGRHSGFSTTEFNKIRQQISDSDSSNNDNIVNPFSTSCPTSANTHPNFSNNVLNDNEDEKMNSSNYDGDSFSRSEIAATSFPLKHRKYPFKLLEHNRLEIKKSEPCVNILYASPLSSVQEPIESIQFKSRTLSPLAGQSSHQSLLTTPKKHFVPHNKHFLIQNKDEKSFFFARNSFSSLNDPSDTQEREVPRDPPFEENKDEENDDPALDLVPKLSVSSCEALKKSDSFMNHQQQQRIRTAQSQSEKSPVNANDSLMSDATSSVSNLAHTSVPVAESDESASVSPSLALLETFKTSPAFRKIADGDAESEEDATRGGKVEEGKHKDDRNNHVEIILTNSSSCSDYNGACAYDAQFEDVLSATLESASNSQNSERKEKEGEEISDVDLVGNSISDVKVVPLRNSSHQNQTTTKTSILPTKFDINSSSINTDNTDNIIIGTSIAQATTTITTPTSTTQLFNIMENVSSLTHTDSASFLISHPSSLHSLLPPAEVEEEEKDAANFSSVESATAAENLSSLLESSGRMCIQQNLQRSFPTDHANSQESVLHDALLMDSSDQSQKTSADQGVPSSTTTNSETTTKNDMSDALPIDASSPVARSSFPFRSSSSTTKTVMLNSFLKPRPPPKVQYVRSSVSSPVTPSPAVCHATLAAAANDLSSELKEQAESEETERLRSLHTPGDVQLLITTLQEESNLFKTNVPSSHHHHHNHDHHFSTRTPKMTLQDLKAYNKSMSITSSSPTPTPKSDTPSSQQAQQLPHLAKRTSKHDSNNNTAVDSEKKGRVSNSATSPPLFPAKSAKSKTKVKETEKDLKDEGGALLTFSAQNKKSSSVSVTSILQSLVDEGQKRRMDYSISHQLPSSTLNSLKNPHNMMNATIKSTTNNDNNNNLTPNLNNQNNRSNDNSPVDLTTTTTKNNNNNNDATVNAATENDKAQQENQKAVAISASSVCRRPRPSYERKSEHLKVKKVDVPLSSSSVLLSSLLPQTSSQSPSRLTGKEEKRAAQGEKLRLSSSDDDDDDDDEGGKVDSFEKIQHELRSSFSSLNVEDDDVLFSRNRTNNLTNVRGSLFLNSVDRKTQFEYKSDSSSSSLLRDGKSSSSSSSSSYSSSSTSSSSSSSYSFRSSSSPCCSDDRSSCMDEDDDDQTGDRSSFLVDSDDVSSLFWDDQEEEERSQWMVASSAQSDSVQSASQTKMVRFIKKDRQTKYFSSYGVSWQLLDVEDAQRLYKLSRCLEKIKHSTQHKLRSEIVSRLFSSHHTEDLSEDEDDETDRFDDVLVDERRKQRGGNGTEQNEGGELSSVSSSSTTTTLAPKSDGSVSLPPQDFFDFTSPSTSFSSFSDLNLKQLKQLLFVEGSPFHLYPPNSPSTNNSNTNNDVIKVSSSSTSSTQFMSGAIPQNSSTFDTNVSSKKVFISPPPLYKNLSLVSEQPSTLDDDEDAVQATHEDQNKSPCFNNKHTEQSLSSLSCDDGHYTKTPIKMKEMKMIVQPHRLSQMTNYNFSSKNDAQALRSENTGSETDEEEQHLQQQLKQPLLRSSIPSFRVVTKTPPPNNQNLLCDTSHVSTDGFSVLSSENHANYIFFNGKSALKRSSRVKYSLKDDELINGILRRLYFDECPIHIYCPKDYVYSEANDILIDKTLKFVDKCNKSRYQIESFSSSSRSSSSSASSMIETSSSSS